MQKKKKVEIRLEKKKIFSHTKEIERKFGSTISLGKRIILDKKLNKNR